MKKMIHRRGAENAKDENFFCPFAETPEGQNRRAFLTYRSYQNHMRAETHE